MPELDLSLPWSIQPARHDPPAVLAARELSFFLEQISGRPVPIENKPAAEGPVIALHCDDEERDGFCWTATGRRIDLHGANPRGLLYAAYSLLEHLGCCWFAPGHAGQSIPRGIRCFTLPETVSEQAALPGRCLIIGHQAFMQDIPDWVRWAARNRLNAIFFHTTTGGLAFGAVPESQYLARRPEFLPLMQERGMTLEHGGHGLTELLPRGLFSEHPQAFRMKDGQRTPDHNFCPSSEAGLEIICRNAAAHFRAHPEVDIFHLWGDDIAGGGWCGCERCAGYSASEQLLIGINALADTLAEINPAAQISLIAYHDTEDVPRRVTPRPNVHVLWAPRMRCYGHPVDDEACRLNVPKYTRTLQQQVSYFNTCGAAPARVFEYYLDAVLFKSVMPPLTTVLQRDAAFYQQAGVHTLQALMTGDYAWTAPQLNCWLFARFAWNPRQDADELIKQFSQAAYGADLLGYYRALEQAFSLALDIRPEQMKITVSHGLRTIWNHPPADMGDPIFAPPELLDEKARRNAGIMDLLAAARRHLDAAAVNADQRLEREQRHFGLLDAWLRYDCARVQLYAAAARGDRAEIRARWKQARAVLEEVYRWGRRNLASPKHRLNFEFIQFYTWNIRLNKIRAEKLAGRPGARWIEWITKARLARYYAGLRNTYNAR